MWNKLEGIKKKKCYFDIFLHTSFFIILQNSVKKKKKLLKTKKFNYRLRRKRI